MAPSTSCESTTPPRRISSPGATPGSPSSSPTTPAPRSASTARGTGRSPPPSCPRRWPRWRRSTPPSSTGMQSTTRMEDVRGFTGGDPLVMSDDLIDKILGRPAETSPAAHQDRHANLDNRPVNEEPARAFGSYHELGRRSLCVVTHFMHPYEVTPETLEAVKDQDAGDGCLQPAGLHLRQQQAL